MKYVEKLGEYFISNWIILFGIIFLSATALLMALPNTVTLNEKYWECKGTMPDGIKAMCTRYEFKGK